MSRFQVFSMVFGLVPLLMGLLFKYYLVPKGIIGPKGKAANFYAGVALIMILVWGVGVMVHRNSSGDAGFF